MNKFLNVAAASALVFAVSGAHAASQASAAISGLNFTLIDLNPDDGIAPSFSFLTSTGSTVLSISASDTLLGESESTSQTRAGTFSFSRDALASLTHAAAQGSLDGQSLAVSGEALGPQTSYSATASTGSNGNYYYYNQPLNLSLSANSLLLIDVDVSLRAMATNPAACGYYYYCNNLETASASASSYLSYTYSGGNVSSSYNGTQTKSLLANAHGESQGYGNWVYDPQYGGYTYVYTTNPKVEEDKQLEESLRSVFSNSSNVTQMATFGLSVSVSGSATTAAIPEPGTYALMVQGLLLGGWLVRRSRRAA